MLNYPYDTATTKFVENAWSIDYNFEFERAKLFVIEKGCEARKCHQAMVI
jgi:hypothetical protein